MRNAAMILGVLGGIVGAVVGFFGYLFAWFDLNYEELTEIAREAGVGVEALDPQVLMAISVVAPILAIVGGAMAPSRPFVAGVVLALSFLGMQTAFGFGLFTAFPMACVGLAAMLAWLGGALPTREAHH